MDKLDIFICERIDMGCKAMAPFVLTGTRIYEKFETGHIGVAKYNREGTLVSTEFFDIDTKIPVDTPT